MTLKDLQLQNAISDLQPRPFDTYILPGFMVYYAFKSKGMPRFARRILFSSGVLMAMRNIGEYKKVALALAPGKDESDGANV